MIRFNEPYLTGKEQDYIADVFARRDFGGNGFFTQSCQDLLAARFGISRVLLTHSCTAALEMSALLCSLGPGDEVIVPSYTFCTTASAMLRTGARVVFCEIDPRTQMMDMADVAERITVRTRAIVPVHYSGIAADMDGLRSAVGDRDITVIEDAAQALGSTLDGKPLGTHGRFGCISFHHTKNLHAGLAGALFVNDPADERDAFCVWERGTNRQQFVDGKVDKYTWVALGSSFYPTELQAAMLLAQLETLDANTRHRLALFDAYREALADLEPRGIAQLPPLDNRRGGNGHAFSLIFRDAPLRDRALRGLNAAGFQAQFHYIPLHSSPMGIAMGYKAEDLPITEDIAKRSLRLPLHFDMTPGDVREIAAALMMLIEGRAH
jgi:dTDP-4-amino-4,6-dideoxygalactose transaminase